MEKLTKTQKKVYDYLREHIKREGVPPSIKEICEALNLVSTSTAHLHLKNLEKKGYIARAKGKSRSISILDNAFYLDDDESNEYKVTNLPVVGAVAAGKPIFADENIESYFPVPLGYIPKGGDFVLRIIGDSMENAGIVNGDYVIVRKQNTANNGDIIIALLDDSATCKKFYKEEQFIRLQPENDRYEPIYVRDVRILGLVVGLFRAMWYERQLFFWKRYRI